LQVARVKGNQFPTEQRIYVCDLRPGYDPRQQAQESTTGGFLKFFETAKVAKSIETPNEKAEITGTRRLEGDLFTFLFGLIEREGKLE
jgi:hypothetical protein